MKKNIFVLLMILSFPALALKIEKRPMKLNYKKYQCKQKILPLIVEYDVIGNRSSIKLISEGSIQDFKISSLRGLDGLTVSSSTMPNVRDMSNGSQVVLNSSFIKPEGLSYLVVDVEGRVGGTLRTQSIPFPIGEMTQKQTADKQKNIKLLKSNKSDQVENFNVMKLDSE